MASQTQGVPSTPSSSVWTTWLRYRRRQVASFSFIALASPRRLACRCRPAGGGRKRGIRNCFGKLNDPGKQGLRRLGILPQQLRTSPLFAPSITFRIWTLLHTGVESHLAGVALVTLAVLAIAAVFPLPWA